MLQALVQLLSSGTLPSWLLQPQAQQQQQQQAQAQQQQLMAAVEGMGKLPFNLEGQLRELLSQAAAMPPPPAGGAGGGGAYGGGVGAADGPSPLWPFPGGHPSLGGQMFDAADGGAVAGPGCVCVCVCSNMCVFVCMCV